MIFDMLKRISKFGNSLLIFPAHFGQFSTFIKKIINCANLTIWSFDFLMTDALKVSHVLANVTDMLT